MTQKQNAKFPNEKVQYPHTPPKKNECQNYADLQGIIHYKFVPQNSQSTILPTSFGMFTAARLSKKDKIFDWISGGQKMSILKVSTLTNAYRQQIYFLLQFFNRISLVTSHAL
jgi:hypothetical protein